MPVHLVIMSEELDLSDNTTCQIYHLSKHLNLDFYYISQDDKLADTPLEGFFSDPRLINDKNRAVHSADALRLGKKFMNDEKKYSIILTNI